VSASRSTIEENAVRRNACINWSTSPQTSESNPLDPASNMPTTVQARCAKCSWSPIRVFSNPRAIAPPTMISELPGENIRPATSRTCGRSRRPDSETPRITTFDGFCAPIFLSEIRMTVSLLMSGRESGPVASAGCVSITFAWSRVMPLWISVSAPRRIAITLSCSPVPTSVRLRPASSISTVAKTNTTSASPPAVNAVVKRRVQRLRAT
jgi:hypothetical protein